MSESKFTPGPWGVCNWYGLESGGIFRNNLAVMAMDACVCMVSGDSNKPVELNARLIAAAPDMYEALKEIARADTIAQSTGKYSLVVESCAESARAAISKAEGKA